MAKYTTQAEAMGRPGLPRSCGLSADSTVPHSWKPTECRFCFAENTETDGNLAIFRIGQGWQCLCLCCGRHFKEIFAVHWRNR